MVWHCVSSFIWWLFDCGGGWFPALRFVKFGNAWQPIANCKGMRQRSETHFMDFIVAKNISFGVKTEIETNRLHGFELITSILLTLYLILISIRILVYLQWYVLRPCLLVLITSEELMLWKYKCYFYILLHGYLQHHLKHHHIQFKWMIFLLNSLLSTSNVSYQGKTNVAFWLFPCSSKQYEIYYIPWKISR